MTDVTDERLNKVLKEFNRMLGKFEEDENILDRLIQFGLTISEAKGWLEKEPNYGRSVLCSYDDSYHERSNRRKVTRT
mgnify:CR=1 FL=1